MDLQRSSPLLTCEQKLQVVSIEDVKAHQRVTGSLEDDLIGGFIEAAYDFLSGPEGWTNGYCLLEETFDLYLDTVDDPITLPVRRFVDGDLVEFERLDPTTGLYVDVDLASYAVVRSDDFGVIATTSANVFSQYEGWWRGLDWNAWQARWQLPVRRKPRAYRIRFAAGWADPGQVPSTLKQAIKLLAGHWFENRESVSSDPRTTALPEQVQFGVRALAGRFRMAADHS